MPSGQSGLRLTAFVGLLMACFRQSKRRTTLFLEAVLGQPCSAGLTVKLQNRVTDALRPAVIWCKLSFGTQSSKGSRFVETLLTVIETCRQQSRNVFEFVTAATTRLDTQLPAPSLLPEA